MRRKEFGPDSFTLPKYETDFHDATEEANTLADTIENMLDKVNDIDR